MRRYYVMTNTDEMVKEAKKQYYKDHAEERTQYIKQYFKDRIEQKKRSLKDTI